jgi:hypothetical protein
MNGRKGSVEVISWSEEDKTANPARRGLIRVKKDGENAGHILNILMGSLYYG